MIRISYALFKLMVLAVTAECQRRAFNANMFRTAGIGRKEWMENYDKLKCVRDMLQGLALEMKNKKAKSVTISIDSLIGDPTPSPSPKMGEGS